MKPSRHHSIATFTVALLAAGLARYAEATVLFSEDFQGGDGGFLEASEGNTPVPFVYDATEGTWRVNGDDSGPSSNTLTSPPIPVPSDGGASVSFQHRHNTESGWDGTALQVSVNGGPFVTVPGADFTAGSYTVADPGDGRPFEGLIGNHVLEGREGFTGESRGYFGGTFVTSTAEVCCMPAGSTITIRFLAAWDQAVVGSAPNWEIDAVTVETLPDTDGDGMADSYEDANQLEKTIDDAAGDADADWLSNLDESLRGTDPHVADTDGDGLSDGVESGTGIFVDSNDTGSNPLVVDSDGDTLLDASETNSGEYVSASDTGTNPNLPDSDGDGFYDDREVSRGTDPNDPGSVPPGGVIAAYSFDDGTAVDNSGNGLDGTVVGATPGDGQFSGAMEFDGSRDAYVTTPNLGRHDEVTIAAWLKMTGRVDDWRAVFGSEFSSAGALNIQFSPRNLLEFSVRSNPGDPDRRGIMRFDQATFDTWRHLVVVYSSIEGFVRFYVDGSLDVEHSWNGLPILLGTGQIGGHAGEDWGFQGSIDEVVFLDYAASPAQVVALMNAGAGPSTSLPAGDDGPALTIDRPIRLRWPASSAPGILETATSLEGPWEAVSPVPPSIVGDQFQVVVPADSDGQFFRLNVQQ